MTILDNGGFDFAVEIAESTIATLLCSPTPLPQIGPALLPIINAGIQGNFKSQIVISDAKLIGPDILSIKAAINGTVFHISHITLAGQLTPVPVDWQEIKPTGAITINDRLEVLGNALIVDFRDNASAKTPDIFFTSDQSTVFESSVLNSPLWWFVRVQARILDSTGALEAQVKAQIVQAVRVQLIDHVRWHMNRGTPDTLIRPPDPIALPIPVVATKFRIGDRAIHMLYDSCGSGGNSSSIMRSMLLRRASDNLPLDVAAINISNSGFLGCILRPVISGSFFLNSGGFVSGHPFFWFGNIPLTISGGLPPLITRVSVTKMSAGIDGTGVRILANLVVIGAGGAFTVNYTVDQTFSLTAPTAVSGREITLTMTPSGPPSVVSDTSIAAWIYLSAFFDGGGILVTIGSAINAFRTNILDGIITGAVTRLLRGVAVPFTIPHNFRNVVIRSISSLQSDAPTRIITVGPIVFPDPFAANDIIINLR